jgi:hypothetical protein
VRFSLYLLYFVGALVWLVGSYGALVDERTSAEGGDDDEACADPEARARKLQQRALRVVGFPLWFVWVFYWGAGELRRLLRELSGRPR